MPNLLKDFIPQKERENFNKRHLQSLKIQIIPSQNENQEEDEIIDQTTNFDSKRNMKTKNV